MLIAAFYLGTAASSVALKFSLKKTPSLEKNYE
jgi:hypothetical protein